MKVRNAWYLKSLPAMVVVQLEDGRLKMFARAPFRHVREDECRPYRGHHPRECAAYPLPGYVLPLYGLSRVGAKER